MWFEVLRWISFGLMWVALTMNVISMVMNVRSRRRYLDALSQCKKLWLELKEKVDNGCG